MRDRKAVIYLNAWPGRAFFAGVRSRPTILEGCIAPSSAAGLTKTHIARSSAGRSGSGTTVLADGGGATHGRGMTRPSGTTPLMSLCRSKKDWQGGAMRKKKMTDKQAAFVREYLVDLNATQAAVRAGYSAKTAGKIGLQQLAKTYIAEAIREAQERRAKRTEITQDKVIREIAKVAFSDPRDLMEWGPDGLVLKDSRSISDDAAMSVTEVSAGRDGTKVKRSDRLKALELLGRHLGLFVDKVQADVKQTTKVILFGGDDDGGV